jgi:hypothetical protein
MTGDLPTATVNAAAAIFASNTVEESRPTSSVAAPDVFDSLQEMQQAEEEEAGDHDDDDEDDDDYFDRQAERHAQLQADLQDQSNSQVANTNTVMMVPLHERGELQAMNPGMQ